MHTSKTERAVTKDSVLKNINEEQVSPLRKYQHVFVGREGFGAFLKYEYLVTVLGPMPGAVGLYLRKKFYPSLFRKVGEGVVWGRNISLRHPYRIDIGHRVAIDDDCLLDGRGAGDSGLSIGSDVLIARSTIIQCKASPIAIGDRCVIGSQAQFSAAGGIYLGNHVMVGGQSYIGGGRYHMNSRDIPIMDQGLYSMGDVLIEDDVWIGAGVTILDGVRIGKGSAIGSGAVIREDVPAYTVVSPYQKLVMLPR